MNIVIIEDSPADARWFEMMLSSTKLSHSLTAYASGMEALKGLKTLPPPQVIACDWFLPVLDLPEMMAALRANPSLASIPVAAFVGYDYQIKLAEELGVALTLRKPVDEAQILLLYDLAGRSTITQGHSGIGFHHDVAEVWN